MVWEACIVKRTWTTRVIDGWKPIARITEWAGVNIVSAMFAGMNGKEVPRGGAQVKYVHPIRMYAMVTALGGTRKDVILGD